MPTLDVPSLTRFRSDIVRFTPGIVDREAGAIYGASAIQTGPALGHGMTVDAKTVEQTVALGNAASAGIKVRFTHPGMCSDGLGTLLGRAKAFRVEAIEAEDGTQSFKALCDIHFNQSSKESPEGDLYTYVLKLADEDPEAFGMSIVFENEPVWMLPDGVEVAVYDDRGNVIDRPEGAAGVPVARVKSLRAVDVVDEPAANRDGLFSATSLDAAEAFDTIDQMRERLGLSLADAHSFALRYLNARGFNPAVPPATTEEGTAVEFTADQLAAMLSAAPDHAEVILAGFKAGKSPEAIQSDVDAAKAEAKDAELAEAKEAADKAHAELAESREKAEAEIAALTAKVESLQAELSEAKDLGGVADPGPGAGGSDEAPTITRAEMASLSSRELGEYFAKNPTATVID